MPILQAVASSRRWPVWLAVALALPACVAPPKRSSADSGPAFRHAAAPPAGGTRKWDPVWWWGNADDPQPPAWYRPGRPLRGLLWQLRNPLHNFTFYVIGVHDADFVRRGRAPAHVFHPDGGWNWAVIERGWLRLPFVSYAGRHVRAYALWREKGNFGLKLQRVRRPAKPLVGPKKVNKS